jgi:hypothetical protein
MAYEESIWDRAMTSRTKDSLQEPNQTTKGAPMPPRQEQRRTQTIARDLADDKIADICQAMGCSKRGLYKWHDRAQADDPNWAKERPRRPRATPAKTPQTIDQTVVSLRRALCQNGPGCGAAAIPQRLEQQGLEPGHSQRMISRSLQRPQKEGTSTTAPLQSLHHLGHSHPALLRLFPP